MVQYKYHFKSLYLRILIYHYFIFKLHYNSDANGVWRLRRDVCTFNAVVVTFTSIKDLNTSLSLPVEFCEFN